MYRAHLSLEWLRKKELHFLCLDPPWHTAPHLLCGNNVFLVQHQRPHDGRHSISMHLTASNIAWVNTQAINGLAVQSLDLKFVQDNLCPDLKLCITYICKKLSFPMSFLPQTVSLDIADQDTVMVGAIYSSTRNSVHCLFLDILYFVGSKKTLIL